MADVTPGRRVPRRPRPVDPVDFIDDIGTAMTAFGQDVSYAVSIARAAVIIQNKRRSWQARKELRAAGDAG